MGDGSLMLLPTPGHTAGSMSLLVRRGTKAPLVLAGDLTYGPTSLRAARFRVGNRHDLAVTSGKVLALKEQMPDLVVLPAHDPTAARRLEALAPRRSGLCIAISHGGLSTSTVRALAAARWVPTTVLGVEDTLHGYLVAHDANSALVVVATGGPSADRAAEGAHELLMAARRIGLQTAAILSPDLEGVILSEDVTAGKLVIPHAALPELVTSLLGGAVALQLLTIGLVHARKTNPDLLRREQAPYREAVAAGRAKHPRR